MDNSLTLLAFGLLGLFFGNLIERLSHKLPITILARQRLFPHGFISAQPPLSPHACHAAYRPFPIGISLCHILFYYGRCPRCHRQIPSAPALVELGCAFLFMCSASGNQHIVPLAILLTLTLILILLALIDARYYLLPDILTLPLLVSGLIAAYLGISTLSFIDAIIGTLFGYMLLWLPARLFLFFCQIHGLGRGDIKLLAAAGAWLGMDSLPAVLLMACLMGTLFCIVRYAFTKVIKSHIPFGPFITFSMWLALLKDPFIIKLSIGI